MRLLGPTLLLLGLALLAGLLLITDENENETVIIVAPEESPTPTPTPEPEEWQPHYDERDGWCQSPFPPDGFCDYRLPVPQA